MRVYFNKRLIVVESNIQWALPYWQRRRQSDKRITWELNNPKG